MVLLHGQRVYWGAIVRPPPLTALDRSTGHSGGPAMPWKTFQSRVRYLPASAQERIRESFLLGEAAHRGQLRKSGEQYFIHCIAVASMLADMRADEDTIVAALLHDTVEDTTLTLDEIERQFGRTVRALIHGVTKLDATDFLHRPSLDERIETLRKIFTLMQEDVRIIFIKLIDRLHNMQTIEFLSEEQQKVLAQETHDVYVKIADRLSMQDLRDELEELCYAVLDKELFMRLHAQRMRAEEIGRRIVVSMEEHLRSARPSFPVEMHFEHKSWTQTLRQVEMGEGIVTGLSALTVAFVCEDTDACYWMLGILHQLWRRETLSFQDFINSPTINGYRGLHTTVILEDGTRVRCKIRTREMHEYAHRGVAMRCFSGDGVGVMESLPWTGRISPLTKTTTERSEEFFASLQNDILGESIVIHGPADQTMMIPKDATALDGALYLFGEDALALTAIKVDGKEVPFHTSLRNAVSLEIVIGSKRTVQRDWLQWVQTGLATAKIRTELMRSHHAKKVAIGRSLLQEVFAQHKKGFLEEFDEWSIVRGLQSLHLTTLDDACVAIAEGHCEPREIYHALFEKKQKTKDTAERRYVVRFTVRNEDATTFRRLVDLYEKYNLQLGQINFWPISFQRNVWNFRLNVHLTQEAMERLKRDLTLAGAQGVGAEFAFARGQHIAGVAALVLLWGLDPVFAKQLLLQGASPFDLTLLRFAVLTLLSGGYLVILALLGWQDETRLRRISPFRRALLLSASALFATALLTYVALDAIAPANYATLIVTGIVALLTLQQWKRGKGTLGFAIGSILSFALLSAILMFEEDIPLGMGSLAGIGASMGFALYALASERYQLQEYVRTRYPFFLFYSSLLGFLASLLLFPLSHFAIFRDPVLLLLATLFVICFTGLPYLLYYKLLKRGAAGAMGQFLPLVVLVASVGQILLFRAWDWMMIFPIILVLCWVLAYRQKDKFLLSVTT